MGQPLCWSPGYWKSYWRSDNPYRKYKWERDRRLAAQFLQPRPDERILEVGCGYGRISEVLLGSGLSRLVGVDHSHLMLEECRRTLRSPFSPCQADALRLPFHSGSFDAALCSGVIMHLADGAGALRELARVLKPGGRLVVSINNLLSPYALPVKLWTLLKSNVRQDFQSPWSCRNRLAGLGIKVRRVAGDTFLAVALEVPRLGWSVLPRWLFPLLRAPDRWVDRPPLNHLAYEIWFQGIKET